MGDVNGSPVSVSSAVPLLLDVAGRARSEGDALAGRGTRPRRGLLRDRRPPAAEEVTNASGSHATGGELVAAEYLLERGDDRDWIGRDGLSPSARVAEAAPAVSSIG